MKFVDLCLGQRFLQVPIYNTIAVTDFSRLGMLELVDQMDLKKELFVRVKGVILVKETAITANFIPKIIEK